MSDQDMTVNADAARLQEQNALLRGELAALLAEVHDLIHLVKPHLLAVYQTRVGAWEVKLLKLQFEAALRKRRIEMAQAFLNRGAKPDRAAMEEQLRQEFVQWQARLQEAAQKVTEATNRLNHLLPDEANLELKKLYRELVKKLHPDLHPSLSENQARLWRRVQEAYEHGDLDELRALALLVGGPAVAGAPAETTLATLMRARETLKRQIEALLKEIETIQSVPPFTLQKQLGDDAWVEARRRDIDAQCAVLEARIAELSAIEHQARKGGGDGKAFGPN